MEIYEKRPPFLVISPCPYLEFFQSHSGILLRGGITGSYYDEKKHRQAFGFILSFILAPVVGHTILLIFRKKN